MQQLALWDFADSDLSELQSIQSNDWRWYFKDYPKSNGLKVFSCFSGGGGSTMGYKLAGYEVVGNCEIDTKMNEIYVHNHRPKYNYCMDLREFNKHDDLPAELYNLDVLDGSPPCTTFSMCGKREKTWGKVKKFREGQVAQTLDDLLFVFIGTVSKLCPKVVVMENVEGLIKGAAWSYVQRIYTEFGKIGYKVRHLLLKGETMGVPQMRHRVFFIATRLNFDLAKIDLSFNYEPIPFGVIKSKQGFPLLRSKTMNYLIKNLRYGDSGLDTVCKRLYNKGSFFNNKLVYDNQVNRTIPAKSANIRWDTKEYLSVQDIINSSTFPQDFDFINNSHANVNYVCGMSVPPVMMKRIAIRILESKIFNKD